MSLSSHDEAALLPVPPEVREAADRLGAAVVAACPPGPSRDAALHRLYECVVYARAACLLDRRP